MKKVLFVCLGNICRSPAAEGVFLHKVISQGLEKSIAIDSAGTSGYHSGSPADPRMQDHAADRGYKLASLSRQFLSSDFEQFDYILAMDEDNYQNILALAPSEQDKKKVYKFCSFCTIHEIEDVPDPYYKGDIGFEYVMDIVEDGCDGLLNHIKQEANL